MTEFIQPVSMRVTQEQYERDLREPLLAMGYKETLITSFSHTPILANNYGNNNGMLSNTCEEAAKIENRHFIPDYNPEYFLAVAAMTNEELGIIGEWWKCIKNGTMRPSNNIAYYSNKLYKSEQKKCITNIYGNKYHMWDKSTPMFEYFTKATLADLINHFECKIDNNKETMELTQQEKDILAKLITKDNEAIFEKLGVKRDKNPIGVLQSDSHAKEEISKYINAAGQRAESIGKNELINRAFVMDDRYSNKYKFVLHEKYGLQVLAIEEK